MIKAKEGRLPEGHPLREVHDKLAQHTFTDGRGDVRDITGRQYTARFKTKHRTPARPAQ